MEILRTPESRFAGSEFATSRYTTLDDGIRIHHAESGDGPPVLLLHGQPSWSYLYRSMIHPLAAAGHRVLAPDLVGFGRSDKPTEVDDHTYERHVAWMSEWLEDTELDGITLFCQDWGGLVGLRLLAAMPDRFDRLVVANTGLPTGEQDLGEAFHAWRRFVAETEDIQWGRIVQGGTTRTLSEDEVAAYDAPFPDRSYMAAPRTMPSLVPIEPDSPSAAENRRAWQTLRTWDRPCLTLFSDGDAITAGGERVFHKLMPGADGQPHRTTHGGHFLQEDSGPELAQAIIDWKP